MVTRVHGGEGEPEAYDLLSLVSGLLYPQVPRAQLRPAPSGGVTALMLAAQAGDAAAVAALIGAGAGVNHTAAVRRGWLCGMWVQG